VHVTIPLVPETYSKIVSISPDVGEPQAGFTLYDIQVTPIKVRVSGRPSLVDRISTLQTRPISIRDRMEDLETDVALHCAGRVTVRTLDDKPLHQVHVRVALKRAVPPDRYSPAHRTPTQPDHRIPNRDLNFNPVNPVLKRNMTQPDAPTTIDSPGWPLRNRSMNLSRCRRRWPASSMRRSTSINATLRCWP